MIKYQLNLFILVFSFINCFLSAQNFNIEKVNNYINYIEKNNLDIGNISIFHNSSEIYNRNFGEVLNPTIMNSYQVGSVTKLFTATLIFKLIQQNKISLDTKLDKYYPDIKNADLITIQNLLEHSSGLNNYVKKDEKITWLTEPRTQNDILTELKKQRILFSPNDSIIYSNSGYYLLGKIIEKEFNQTYGKALKKYITKPLKLKKTKSASENPKRISYSYYFENDKWIVNKDFYFKNIIGVGDISSTPKDLNVFINALFRGNVISMQNLNKIKPIIGKETYGRGLMTFKFYNLDFYGNTGGTYGTNSILIFDDKTNISIALVINGEQYPRNDFIKDIVNIVFNNELNYPESK